jgi:hypothetical protein
LKTKIIKHVRKVGELRGHSPINVGYKLFKDIKRNLPEQIKRKKLLQSGPRETISWICNSRIKNELFMHAGIIVNYIICKEKKAGQRLVHKSKTFQKKKTVVMSVKECEMPKHFTF